MERFWIRENVYEIHNDGKKDYKYGYRIPVSSVVWKLFFQPLLIRKEKKEYYYNQWLLIEKKKCRQFSRLETELDTLMQDDLSNEKDRAVTLQREVDEKVSW